MAINVSQVSSMASSLFTKLDTKKQGYFEIDDLKSAFDKIQDTQSDAQDVFSQLDADGDGKVTQSELTSSMQSIADSLDNQFNDMRMSMAMAGMGMMPPAPPAEDAGFSKDELQSQLDEIGSSDSKRESLLSKIVANFDDADADGDGKVSFTEAMAYDQSSSDGAKSASLAMDQNTLFTKVLQMLQAYNHFSDSSKGSGISTSA